MATLAEKSAVSVVVIYSSMGGKIKGAKVRISKNYIFFEINKAV